MFPSHVVANESLTILLVSTTILGRHLNSFSFYLLGLEVDDTASPWD